ncbi:MAG: hypothetical protein ACRETU_00485 [Steroidobacterales bacterium]
MPVDEEDPRASAAARLAESRLELRQMLDHRLNDGTNGRFPRSRAMQALMDHPALAVAAAVTGGFLIARPGMIRRVASFVPVAAIARMLVARYVTRAMKDQGVVP